MHAECDDVFRPHVPRSKPASPQQVNCNTCLASLCQHTGQTQSRTTVNPAKARGFTVRLGDILFFGTRCPIWRGSNDRSACSTCACLPRRHISHALRVAINSKIGNRGGSLSYMQKFCQKVTSLRVCIYLIRTTFSPLPRALTNIEEVGHTR